MASKSFAIPGFDTEQGRAYVQSMATTAPAGVTLEELRLRYMALRGPVWRMPISEVDPRWMVINPGKSYQGAGGIVHEFPHDPAEGPTTHCRGGHGGRDTPCDATAPSLADGQTRWRYVGLVEPPEFDGDDETIEQLARTLTGEAATWLSEHEPAVNLADTSLGWLLQRFDIEPATPVAVRGRSWWVNQGLTYDRESAGGYVWAPVRGRNGLEISHHRTVSELQVGDLIVHYANGRVRALSRVTEDPGFARKPDEIVETDWEEEGRLARAEYSELTPGIAIDRIPVSWRIEERGPFNSLGGVNQGYLFPISPEFTERLMTFPEIRTALGLPAGSDAEVLHLAQLDGIAASLEREGLVIDRRTLRRFHLSLGTRGFVILSGVSGTGKTWLAQAYARAVGGEHAVVPVAPNWTTNEDLLGYLSPIDGLYHDTAFSRFVRRAADDWVSSQAEGRAPGTFFLILDEMNLARVEYYFAQFLSALEVRAREGAGVLHLGAKEVALGSNLKFVGTVNIDETTHGFADKVYDRAQLIELAAPREAIVKHSAGEAWSADLVAVWDAIHEVAPFAFRVIDEIRAYVAAARAVGVDPTDAFDEQLLQKVLPKIKGLDPRVGNALEAFVSLSEGRSG